MRSSRLSLAIVLAALPAPVLAVPLSNTQPARLSAAAVDLARDAVAPDPGVAASATSALRAMGPAGLAAMLDVHGARLAAGRPAPGRMDADWERFSAALDAVAGQRNAYASRLFWHTDLERAKAEARDSGRPVLSLHLLGRLDEELSCANSRFFRTVLYANARVSTYLREHFVLHWKSERPAPRITIDFGDGRRLERTITGNSVHYVLDADGRPVDAIPGLYGPEAFVRALRSAEPVAVACSRLEASAYRNAVRDFHARRAASLDAELTAALARSRAAALRRDRPRDRGRAEASEAAPRALDGPSTRETPDAVAAERLTVTKSAVELPIVAAIGLGGGATDRPEWDRLLALLAASRADDARLDASSRALVSYHLPTDVDGMSIPKGATRDAVVDALVARLEGSVALDSVRNELTLHRRIDDWFVDTDAPAIGALNDWVYTNLFLTPRADAWLGLFEVDVYTGLDGGGVRVP